MSQQPTTELRLQIQAMLAVAAVMDRVETAGVPQDVTPSWNFAGGSATGTFPDDPRAMFALSRWCQAMNLRHGVTHRVVQRAHGQQIVWTVATTVGDVSVHLVASAPFPARQYGRELVDA